MPSETNGTAAAPASSKGGNKSVNGHTTEFPPVSRNTGPLQLSAALDQFKSFQSTPVIGQEFPEAKLVDWLTAPNSDELLRDLAITVSQRGVVFFPAQVDITDDHLKEIAQRLGEQSGKPSSSGLHIHPTSNSGRSTGAADDEISVISSVQSKTLYQGSALDPSIKKRQNGATGWHSDITWETIPSDYGVLRMTQLPSCGGGQTLFVPSLLPYSTQQLTVTRAYVDTIWASGYELYDRISAPVQRFLESLTMHCAQPELHETAERCEFSLYSAPRGSPFNVGEQLTATHPVIRTNPVTGWKSVYAVGQHVSHINDITPFESKALMDWFLDLILKNHDMQVRHKWVNVGDVAIWDNRSFYHTGTPDYEGLGDRAMHRSVSIGEKPYFDPNSRSKSGV